MEEFYPSSFNELLELCKNGDVDTKLIWLNEWIHTHRDLEKLNINRCKKTKEFADCITCAEDEEQRRMIQKRFEAEMQILNGNELLMLVRLEEYERHIRKTDSKMQPKHLEKWMQFAKSNKE